MKEPRTLTLVVSLPLLLALLAAGAAGAGTAAAGTAPEEPVLVRISVETPEEMDTLGAMNLDVVAVRPGRYVEAYLVRRERLEAVKRGFEIRAVPDRSRDYLLHLGEQGAIPAAGRDWTSYPTYDQMTSWLQGLAADPAYADLMELTSAGRSYQGRELWVVKISDNAHSEGAEPEFKYISSMHGNEVIGVPLCLNLIEHLLASYVGGNPAIVDLVDQREIFILPLMNPDGYEAGTRYNAQGVDLNRDFPDFVTDPNNTPQGRAPETAAIMQWELQHTFVLSANFHAGALVVNYPWDSTHDLNPDDTFFYNMSLGYSVRNPPMYNSPVFPYGVVRGSEWYIIHGGMQDWNYYWYADFDVTIELSDDFSPPASQIRGYWDDNRDAMLYLIDLAGKGLTGTVTDAVTGAPLRAEIRVQGIDMPAPVAADPDQGNYVRPLYSGVYDVTCSAYGYFPVTLQGVPIDWEQATVRDVQLEPMPVQPILHVQSVGVDDSAGGNGNGAIDPGETVRLAVTLENSGIGTATGVSGRMHPLGDPYVVLRQGGSLRPGTRVPFPDIPELSTGTNATPFVIDAGAATPRFRTIPFTLDVTADGGVASTERFVLMIGGVLFEDDMEGGGEGHWTHEAAQGADDWSIVLEETSHTPPHCWFSSDVGSVKDDYLITEPFDLARKTELVFWHRYDMESSFDGCVLEISIDGGPWSDLGPSITQGGYDSVISTLYESPIGGRAAWSGSSGSVMEEVRVDLAAYRGANVRVRWRLACDSSVSADGWYVDDVRVEASPQSTVGWTN